MQARVDTLEAEFASMAEESQSLLGSISEEQNSLEQQLREAETRFAEAKAAKEREVERLRKALDAHAEVCW